MKTDQQSIYQALRRLFRNRAPGAVYYYRKDDKDSLFTYGLAEIRKKIPVKPRTSFNLYSITKVFTATAIFQLQEKGLLYIDDPVMSYIDHYPFAEKVKIRHLLSHISGLPNPMPLAWTHLPDEHEAFDYSGFADGMISQYSSLRYDPGQKFSYSNIGYLVLGKIIEKVSGESYESFIRNQILGKLNIPLPDLGFDINEQEMHATGYQKRFSLINLILGLFIDKKKFTDKPIKRWKPFKPLFVNGPPYGGLIGNASGLGAFLSDMISDKPMVLKMDSIRQMLTEQKTSKGKPTGTSMGWFTGTLKGSKYFCHSGGGGGYYCEVRIYPERKMASALFSNSSGMRDDRLLTKLDRRILQ